MNHSVKRWAVIADEIDPGHFPIEAKIGAKEFNRIDALFYRSNIKMDKFMLRIFGLEKTILIKGIALEAVQIFYPNYKSRT